MSKIVEPNKFNIAIAGAAIKRGDLVAFPTETVYGLGANGLSNEACKKIYEAKGRPSDNPLILHVTGIEQAKTLVKCWPNTAEILAKTFWPGPLTIILPAKENIPTVVTAGLKTVALRCPDNEIALDLIKASGVPIAAPSANLSGRPSPTTAIHVDDDLGKSVYSILDGGQTEVGLESTIIDLSVNPPAVLRPGHINSKDIKSVIGDINDGSISLSFDETPKAPGMKYRHYAPVAPCKILLGDSKAVLKYLASEIALQPVKTALLIFEDTISELPAYLPISEDLVICSIGNRSNPSDMAHLLYDALRFCDDQKVSSIFVEGFENPSKSDDSAAVMNRLLKSAGQNVIKL